MKPKENSNFLAQQRKQDWSDMGSGWLWGAGPTLTELKLFCKRHMQDDASLQYICNTHLEANWVDLAV